LQAVILDLASVCEVAEEYIASSGLQDRIGTRAFDIWIDPFPKADLHFYSDLFHDFTSGKCLALARKSFADLEAGGRIIVHEMLYDSGKTGPFTVTGYNVSMLLWTEGQQFSGRELSLMLKEAGFADVRVVPTFGYWHICHREETVKGRFHVRDALTHDNINAAQHDLQRHRMFVIPECLNRVL
jgi:hypothetical protein